MSYKGRSIILFLVIIYNCSFAQSAESNYISFYGNAYTCPRAISDSIELISKQGLLPWKDVKRTTKVYFYVTKPGQITLSLKLKNSSNNCDLTIGLDGSKNAKNLYLVKKNDFQLVYIGTYTIVDTGYHFVEIKGNSQKFITYPLIEALVIENSNNGSVLFNKSNYRGAASTHLNYSVVGDSAVQWFYTEVRVPDEVKNSVNAYYETNGFHSGYGGIQINNPSERRFIFSIWSLFKTDDPKQIPLEYLVHLNKKGAGVFTGEFRDEGSGGHSHLVDPWKTNTTYRFLTAITALIGDSATYVGYYAAPNDGYQWHMLSKWTQHKTDTKTGFKHLYAFVENFGDNGDDFFKAYYSNQWAITFNGTWMELTEAKFTTTANNKTHQRFDYGAGVEDGKFYMFTGGFKHSRNIMPGDIITRPATGKHIEIDFKKLEGVE
jgi:hypothetical protein